MNFLKEGALPIVDLVSWRVRSLPTTEKLITSVHYHQIYRSTVDFSGLEDKQKEAEIPRGFPSQKVCNSTRSGSKSSEGKEIDLVHLCMLLLEEL